jgi:dihydroflavonol-4-reductase
MVDVRDVADTHVAAMENPAAAGERFIASADFMWFKDGAQIVRAAFPAYDSKIPKAIVPDFMLKLMAIFQPIYRQTVTELGRTRAASGAKAERMLGVKYRPAKEALLASVQSLIDLKVI